MEITYPMFKEEKSTKVKINPGAKTLLLDFPDVQLQFSQSYFQGWAFGEESHPQDQEGRKAPCSIFYRARGGRNGRRISALGSGRRTRAPDSSYGPHQRGASGTDSARPEICRACGHRVLPAVVADGHQGLAQKMDRGWSALPPQPWFFKTGISRRERSSLTKQDVCVAPRRPNAFILLSFCKEQDAQLQLDEP